MQKIDVLEHSKEILQTLAKGAFLNTAANGKQNTMTIAWGSLGYMWQQPVFTVMVRQTRYTKELLDANPVFTVSLPVQGDFAKALGLCGTKSGRELDKFAAAGLTAAAAQTVDAPIIKGCGLHLECRVVDVQTQSAASLDKAMAAKFYADQNWHTYYTGIITAAYLE